MVLCFLASILNAEKKELMENLLSDDFQERQQAEQELVVWVREKESKERAESLFQRYVKSEDPEEFHRLAKILLDVHFEYKKDAIPQTGTGFLGIRMHRPNQGFRVPRFEAEELEKFEALDPSKGVHVIEVIPQTPADKAGLLAGDIIQALDGEDISGNDPPERLMEIVGGSLPGSKILLKIEREGEAIEKEVTLMNSAAIPELPFNGEQARVDLEKEKQLLKADYLRWLSGERLAKRALK